jgi:hypothetical protein
MDEISLALFPPRFVKTRKRTSFRNLRTEREWPSQGRVVPVAPGAEKEDS